MNHFPANQNLDEIPSMDRVVGLGDPAPVCCPKCLEQMELGQVDDCMVILCKACKGILIQSQVFSQVVQNRRKQFSGADSKPVPLDSKQLQQKIKCPGCKSVMEVHPYHGPGNVVIDSCSQCWFTFLDYGELAAIERAPGRR